MNFNPYVILEIGVDATDDEIKRAYLSAVKRAHPDAGGTVGDFLLVRKAFAVLSDPAARAHFDETGRVSEKDPEGHARSMALQIIEGFLARRIGDWLSGKGGDPRRADLFGEMRAAFHKDIADGYKSIMEGEQIKEFVEDMASRFSSPDPESSIQRLFDSRVNAISAQIEDCGKAMEFRRVALAIIDGYEFRRDE